jgi:2-oxoacid:acceptor oxidoreductase delta subunit (pyruvate/2-ketoisovalerate family)
VEGVPGIEIKDGDIQVGPDLMTGHPGIFAGGDMVPGALSGAAVIPAGSGAGQIRRGRSGGDGLGEDRTVTTAIGHGKKAARHIDTWLRGGSPNGAKPRPELATFDRLNTWYYPTSPATARPRLDPDRRVSTFDEVVGGLDAASALVEARRCLSCGNCFECDNCYGMCPDDAIIKLGPGQLFAIDLDFCKGCGICAAECPAGAITMIPEET